MSRGKTISKRASTLIAAAAALAVALPSAGAQDEATEEFTAVAMNTSTRPTTQPQPARASTAQLTIRIDRWSTDEERDKRLAIVKQHESDINSMNQELLRTLQQLPSIGHIRESTTLAWDLRFARQTPLDEGGRRIVLATDRPMPFWEVRDRPRSVDYPFTVIEMHLDKENRGEGKLLADTRIIFEPSTNDLVLQDFNTQPVRLGQIRPRR